MRTYKHFTALIRYKMALRGLGNKEMAAALGMCQKTWEVKKSAPQRMSIGDVMNVFEFLRFTESERKEALYDG